MTDIHELRGFERYLNSLSGSGASGISNLALRARLDSLRPVVPFDLEPMPFNGRPIYSVTEYNRQQDLSDQYAAVRKWHELSERLDELAEIVK